MDPKVPAHRSAHVSRRTSDDVGLPPESSRSYRGADVSDLGGLVQTVKNDYKTWRALGPGGLPANVGGWLIATALRPLSRRDLMTVAIASRAGRHWHLEPRRGPRPTIAPYPIPHRQLTDRATPGLTVRITGAVATEARTDNRYHLARSHFERRGDALYLTDVTAAAPWISRTNGEILHVHETEGSMHVVMQPDDAQTVISAGWGELHPLAGRPGLGLPETYVFLYAPRNSDDADRIEQIIHRATATSTR